jgi:hypothetical protein
VHLASDWFRKASWGAAEAADFEKRLARARPNSRPQYLYIQACSLLESGKGELARQAVILADRSIAASEPHIHLSACHQLKGQCFELLGDLDSALASFLEAVDSERLHPGALTDAYLDFCWAVALHRIPARYERALSLLDQFADRRDLPVTRFREHAVRALIANDVASHDLARAEARLALKFAAVTHSGFRYHPSVGLVTDRYQAVLQQLEEIATAG